MTNYLGRLLPIGAAIILAASGAWAGQSKPQVKNPDAFLKGTYVFGFIGNTLDNNSDVGQLGAAGILSFDGSGHVVGGHFTFSGADSSDTADNTFDFFNCGDLAPDPSSSYSVNPDLTGTIDLTLPANSTCFPNETLLIGFAGSKKKLDPAKKQRTFPIFSTNVSQSLLTNTGPMEQEKILSLTATGQMFTQRPGCIDIDHDGDCNSFDSSGPN